MADSTSPNSRLEELLAKLGTAIGGSVSDSGEVNGWIRRIRDAGYHIYVVLDARIGVDRDKKKAYEAARKGKTTEDLPEVEAIPPAALSRHVLYPPASTEFVLNRGDVRFLEALGIDGTRRVRRRNLPEQAED